MGAAGGVADDDLAGLRRGVDAGDEGHGVPSRCGGAGGASADEVLDGPLVEGDEVVVARGRGLGVEVLEGAAVGQEVGRGLALAQGGLAQLVDARDPQGLLDGRVGAEGPGLVGQLEVHLHVRRGRLPHALDAVGARGLVVEVDGALVADANRIDKRLSLLS